MGAGSALVACGLCINTFIYLIRFGLVSKLLDEVLDCSVGDPQACTNLSGEANTVTDRVIFYTLLSCCIGLGGCATIVLHMRRMTPTSTLLSILVLIVTLGLDFLSFGYGAQQLAYDQDPTLNSGSLGQLASAFSFCQPPITLLLIGALSVTSGEIPSRESDRSVIVIMILMALNFAMFIGRISICAHLEYDRLSSCNSPGSAACASYNADINDVTNFLIESTFLSAMVGIMAQVVVLVHLAKRTKTSKVMASAFVVIAATLSLYGFGFSIKQYSISYLDTNDNHLNLGERAETLGAFSIVQTVLLALLVWAVRTSFGGVQHDQTANRSQLVTATYIVTIIINGGLYIARLAVAGSLLENQFQCGAGHQGDCFKFNSETSVVTPVLINATNFTALYGLGALIVVAWFHLSKWTITTEILSSAITYPALVLNALCFGITFKQQTIKYFVQNVVDDKLEAVDRGFILGLLTLVHLGFCVFLIWVLAILSPTRYLDDLDKNPKHLQAK
eukprot:c20969_g1_i1.p1 GENE.c20969_g1_i1~~c20969_g1_i1.p1  ORF type:complete len:505 (+),score=97.04 c20969_g1_i1:50-1564(+)